MVSRLNRNSLPENLCLLMIGSNKAVKNPTSEKHTTPMLTLEALMEA